MPSKFLARPIFIFTQDIHSLNYRILDSKNSNFPKGSHVYGFFGWRTHTICNPETMDKSTVYVLPEMGSLPVSLGLSYVGRPGNTAYFGFLEICKPKAGETVVVTGAAGAVGSLVGQIAKIKGCRVIGFAGSDEKCDWIKNELGFDIAINYKNGDMKKAIKEAAPDGVDCYFDNVGGQLSSIILKQMKLFGRVSVCGSISSYNLKVDDWPMVPHIQPDFINKQVKMEGFVVSRWADRWLEGLTQNYKWIAEGKIKYQETVTDGFENMPQALIGILRGENTGKAIVKV